MMMAEIYESEGNIAAACEVIQDVHVETYGSIPKVDKVYYIIEQVLHLSAILRSIYFLFFRFA